MKRKLALPCYFLRYNNAYIGFDCWWWTSGGQGREGWSRCGPGHLPDIYIGSGYPDKILVLTDNYLWDGGVHPSKELALGNL